MSVLHDAQLDAAYRYCRRVNSQHGKTFYLATALLPAWKRPAVHALYGFARHADDLVDHPAPGDPPAARLARLRDELTDALAGRPARHPTVRAVADTVHRYGLDHRYLKAFLDSMANDLVVARYPTFDDLREYMWGSASVIGLQLLPVLGVDGALAEAEPFASDLGIAFQLTNFIRDIGEDYRRGRIYLPQDSLTEHAVTESMLTSSVSSPQLKSLVQAAVARARSFYSRAEPGIELLAADARDCVRTAFVLYGEILIQIERADYDVLRQRAAVSRARRLRVGLAGYRAARRARRSRNR
jgi:15-cis-phytoene synthase